jgi:hypothetical protein
MYVIVKRGEQPTDVNVYSGGDTFEKAVASAFFSHAQIAEILSSGDEYDLDHFEKCGEYTDEDDVSIMICFVEQS